MSRGRRTARVRILILKGGCGDEPIVQTQAGVEIDHTTIQSVALWKLSTGPPHATKYTAETSVLTTSTTRTATTATTKKFASR